VFGSGVVRSRLQTFGILFSYVRSHCFVLLTCQMTELPDNCGQTLSLPGQVSKPASRWKKAALAGLLGLLFPGMGQLYNRQPRKGFLLAFVSLALGMTMVKTRLLFTFSTMVTTILTLIIWKFFVAAEAAYAAATEKRPEPAIPLPRITYPILVIVFFVATLFPSPDQLRGEAGFAAFKISSTSMCPTLCLGERVVADRFAYKSKPPQRGDLIFMKHASSDALFVKRVIGVAGDRVAPSSDGTILVNGQPFKRPVPCASFSWQKMEPGDYSVFQSTIVPDGSYFVVGDNLTNSFDSRLPDFGPVTQDMIRGRPLFIYWSKVNSRFGCSIR
jgi:signal peptidase I